MLSWLSHRFELTRGESSNFRSMEGLRGAAVFLVFLVHYATLVQPWIAGNMGLVRVVHALHTVGNVGVDLFFVLSGYLIYGSVMGKPQPYTVFMRRRAQRIYPAFLVVFAVYLLLSWAFPAENKIPSSSLAAAIYIAQNLLLLPGLLPIEPVLTVAWSLSYEMFFYLVLPLAVAGFRLRHWGVRSRVLLLLGVAVVVIVVGALVGGPVRMAMFLAGMLLYEAMQADAGPALLKKLGSGAGALALILGLLIMLLPNRGPWMLMLKMGVLFVSFWTLCWVCLQGRHGLSSVFSWTPLRWLGNMSYSYYLIHGLALKVVFFVLAKVWPSAGQGWVFFALALVLTWLITLVPATVLFLTIERRYSLRPVPTGVSLPPQVNAQFQRS